VISFLPNSETGVYERCAPCAAVLSVAGLQVFPALFPLYTHREASLRDISLTHREASLRDINLSAHREASLRDINHIIHREASLRDIYHLIHREASLGGIYTPYTPGG